MNHPEKYSTIIIIIIIIIIINIIIINIIIITIIRYFCRIYANDQTQMNIYFSYKITALLRNEINVSHYLSITISI